MDLKRIVAFLGIILVAGPLAWILRDKISLTLVLTLVATLFAAAASVYGLKWWNYRETKKNALVLPPPPQPQQGQATTAQPKNPTYNTSKKQLLLYCVVFYLALIATTFVLSIFLTFPLWIIAIFFCAGHFYLSFDQIDAGQHAIILAFGKIIFSTEKDRPEEGWVIVPYPFFKIEKVTRGVIKCEFGSPFTRRTDEEKVEEIDEEQSDFVDRQPFRPNFLDIASIEAKGETDQRSYPPRLRLRNISIDDVKKLKNDPLHGPITPDPKFFFTFKIRDMGCFYRNVPGDDVEEKLANLAKLITDQCKTTISEIAGITTFGFFLSNQEIVNGRLRHRVEILLGERESFSKKKKAREFQEKNYPDLGADLNNIRMKDPGLTLSVNKALSSNAASGYKKGEMIKISEGKKAELINEGEGRAEALKASLLAEAEGLLRIAQTASNNPNAMAILQLKSLVESMQKSNVTLLPADLSTIASATAAVKGLLGNKTP